MPLINFLQPLVQSLKLTTNGSDCPAKPLQMGRVVPDPNRCVQCGICEYNCPIGIPVRDYAHRGIPVDDHNCITCGQCVNVCPRGTLRWETKTHTLIADRFPTTVDPILYKKQEVPEKAL